MTDDARWLDRALALARSALGNTTPNPAVGAVVVRDGVVLGEGATRPAGSDHAEIVALADARSRGHDPRGATMYVTLEPCCHHGRTPPCTDAILASGVERVVVGCVDPFPPMQGRALGLLRERGVEVTLVDSEPCTRQILGFSRAVTSGLPEVTLKVAVSADGHIATAGGESRWITGPIARQDGHALRASHDAILVGIGTVLADDPELTCRLPQLPPGRGSAHPIPVILDSELRIRDTAAVLRHPRGALVFCADDAATRDLPAEVIRAPRGPDRKLDLRFVLRELVSRRVHRLLVEGGAEVHRSFVDARLADTLVEYVGPMLLPGGRPWLAGRPLGRLLYAPRLQLVDARAVGPDARLEFRFTPGEEP